MRRELILWKGTTVVAAVLVASLVGFNVWLYMQPTKSAVEAKSAIDMSVLHLTNPGCKVLDPSGHSLDMDKSTLIPKGSFITGECFTAKS